ncbi:hypothetical protein ACHWQZ_G010570 [Mnemiopsis leidyi]
MLRRCTFILRSAGEISRCRAVATSCPSLALEEFFPPNFLTAAKEERFVEEADEPEEDTVFQSNPADYEFGRSWKKSDLHVLKSPVLHSLWYVLLKERNRCLTVDAYYRQYQKRLSPYSKRLAAVQESMENLKEVIEERELSIDTAKTHLWMKRVSNLLGEEYAQDLAATYVTYTLPHKEEEKKEMIEMKHHQLFTKELNRVRQPYDQWDIRYEMPEIDSEYESKLRNYESEDYVHEDDFDPGLEGFLHNVKRKDWEELEKQPADMKESRERREEDRLKIIKRIAEKRRPDDVKAELENLRRWKKRIEGDSSLKSGDSEPNDNS